MKHSKVRGKRMLAMLSKKDKARRPDRKQKHRPKYDVSVFLYIQEN